jgi:hypothetical protein
MESASEMVMLEASPRSRKLFANIVGKGSVFLVLAVAVLGTLVWTIVVSKVGYGATVSIAAAILVTLSTPIIVNRPYILFYLHMLTYTVGEVGFSVSKVLPDISFTNFLFAYSLLLVGFREAELKGRSRGLPLKLDRRAAVCLALATAFAISVIMSSLWNNSLGFITTAVSYVIAPFLVIYLVRNGRILANGLLMGLASISTLAILTVGRSYGLLGIGYRAPWTSGIIPWGQTLPRAIGVPQLEGGLHGAFILAMLPVGLILFIEGDRLGGVLRGLTVIGVLLGALAIIVAAYRSGWLGLCVGVGVAFLIAISKVSLSKRIVFAGLLLLLAVVGLFLYRDISNVVSAGLDIFWRIRPNTVETRLAQYSYAIDVLVSDPRPLLVGKGYKTFREMFPGVRGIRGSHDIGLHNHFLGIAHAFGVLALIPYVLAISLALYWLLKDAVDPQSAIGTLSSGLAAGLIGVVVVMSFTAALAGYKIVWTIVGIASLTRSFKTNQAL